MTSRRHLLGDLIHDMQDQSGSAKTRTAYAAFAPWSARLLLMLLVILVAMPAIPHPPLKIPGERQAWGAVETGYTDKTLYKDILSDVERGEDYCLAAAGEQRAHHYPTAPAQVFREPTLAWLLARALHFHVVQIAAFFGIYAAILVALYRNLVALGKSITRSA